jgi:uncharacterized protein (DUF2237 family)
MKLDVELNVLGTELELCSDFPKTGFYRNGHCSTGPQDLGSHTVCVQVTDDFLSFSQKKGNDLSTPISAFNFSGLKAGDKWCLCAARWKEAFEAGVAPKVFLRATHAKALKVVGLSELKQYAIDLN